MHSKIIDVDVVFTDSYIFQLVPWKVQVDLDLTQSKSDQNVELALMKPANHMEVVIP